MQDATFADRQRSKASSLRLAFVVLLVGALMVALMPPSTSTSAHAEEAESEVTITLLATNDFHGRLQRPASGNLGGAAYLKTLLDDIRADKPNALYVDGGDLVGATPVLSNLFFDEPTIEVMNLLGMDVQTVGNHEFDRGQDEVLRRAFGGCLDDDCDYRGGTEFEGSDFITLSTNVVVDEDDETLMPDWAIFEVEGVNVGFIGVTTINTPNVVSPTGIEGLTFLPEAEAVNATVPLLQDEGADIIVVLMHEGARQNVSNPDPNECENRTGAAATIVPQFDEAVDVVVEGHTHQSYVCDLEDGPLVTQAFEYGKRLTEIDLVFDTDTGEIVDRSATNHDVVNSGDGALEPDPEILEFIAEYEELAGPALLEEVGLSEVYIERTTRLRESAQGNLSTDALLYTYADADIDFAFQNSGGLRADLTDPANVILPEFPDLGENNAHYDNLRELAGAGVFQGRADGNLQPRSTLTRGQIASLIQRILDLEDVDPSFPDAVGTTHAGAIGAIEDLDIVGGFPDGNFRPNATLSRGQIATILANWLEVEGVEDGPFSDTATTVHRTNINALAELEILGGFPDGTFRPNNPVLRDQSATLLLNTLDEAGIELEYDDEFVDWPILRQDVLAVWPFGNIVALAEVDGPTLLAILENGVREIGGGRFIQVGGLRIDYSIDESVDPADNNGFPRGQIENVEYWNHPDFDDGDPVDLSESATHRIAMNDFMSVGGDGYPVITDDVFSLQDPLEIAVEVYLQDNSPVNPQVEGRIVEIEPSNG